VRTVRSGIDDGLMTPGPVNPREWTMALAYLKARAGWEALQGEPTGVVLGADTMVVHHDKMLGQPRDEADARRMIRTLASDDHEVVTGVAILWADGGVMRRVIFADEARVRVGHILEPAIEEYVASGGWRGKAGAYNLAERVDAGWPIEWTGDPASIMGLPMIRLGPILQGLPRPDAAASA